jgi:hypothetical protein
MSGDDGEVITSLGYVRTSYFRLGEVLSVISG